MLFRTDNNNNPTAFTTDIAKEALLTLGLDYVPGDSFISDGRTFVTAKLLGDPVLITIKVIDKLGFYTVAPHARWSYIAIPYKLWMGLTLQEKQYVIGYMYQNEGGTAMKHLFPANPTS